MSIMSNPIVCINCYLNKPYSNNFTCNCKTCNLPGEEDIVTLSLKQRNLSKSQYKVNQSNTNKYLINQPICH